MDGDKRAEENMKVARISITHAYADKIAVYVSKQARHTRRSISTCSWPAQIHAPLFDLHVRHIAEIATTAWCATIIIVRLSTTVPCMQNAAVQELWSGGFMIQVSDWSIPMVMTCNSKNEEGCRAKFYENLTCQVSTVTNQSRFLWLFRRDRVSKSATPRIVFIDVGHLQLGTQSYVTFEVMRNCWAHPFFGWHQNTHILEDPMRAWYF